MALCRGKALSGPARQLHQPQLLCPLRRGLGLVGRGLEGGRRGLGQALGQIVRERQCPRKGGLCGERGRGGAAFPAGIKWKTVAAATFKPEYVEP